MGKELQAGQVCDEQNNVTVGESVFDHLAVCVAGSMSERGREEHEAKNQSERFKARACWDGVFHAIYPSGGSQLDESS